MSFSIDIYSRQYLNGMTALYNAETDFEPYIAPLDPDRFMELVESKSYFDPSGVFVAHEKGQVVGWIHACVAPGSEGHHDPGNKIPRIRMLIFPRDCLNEREMEFIFLRPSETALSPSLCFSTYTPQPHRSRPGSICMQSLPAFQWK